MATIAAVLGLAPEGIGRPTAARAEATASPPNIVFIMVDDMRNDDLRFMPNTRQLIRDKGVRFVNSFSPYPLCCPARASVLTGLYTHNHRVYTVQADYGFHAFDDHQTLATMLQRVGYATVYLGKYLNRYGIDPPHDNSTANSLRYVPPGWTMWRASLDGGFAPGSRWDGGTYRYLDTTLSFNGQGFEALEGRYQTNAYGDIARSIIRNRAADPQPFLLYLSFTAPHTGGPHEADDPAPTRLPNGTLYDWKTPARPTGVWGYWNNVVKAAPGASWRDPDFVDKPAYLRSLAPLTDIDRRRALKVTRERAESLIVVDRQVGALMRTLAETGELGRTLVVFTSDNGYFLGEQRMRLGKVFPHEPSLRVPLLMRGPGIPAGEIRRDPFTSVDYLPTLADVAGTLPEHAPDGISLWDVARYGDTGWRRAVLTETGSLGHPARDTNLAGLPLEPGERPDPRFLLGVRTQRYLYVDVARQRDELYDLYTDPREYRNLDGDPDYTAIEALLRGQLQQIRACRADNCALPLPGALQAGP